MTTLKFKCELLSDVILNMKSASEGNNRTLDFIPGNCFLGIAASSLYENGSEESLTLFHSGKVRFGDGHPCSSADSKTRSLRTPAAMFYPKGQKTSGKPYIYPYISEEIINSKDFKSKQVKQCRGGFYEFTKNTGVPVAVDKTFAIKSAYNRTLRRSEDGQMYGYESLSKGCIFLFSVETDDESLTGKIKSALVGTRHIGRSKSAQYGLVEISEYNFDEICSAAVTASEHMVYADGRLIFINNETGQTSFRPTAKDLGFSDGEIDWTRSQTRTFQYSPWNAKRKCFDTDRCGFEKGSVFVVKAATCPKDSKFVGSYNNEGFGKVIYNPWVLNADNKGIGIVSLLERLCSSVGESKSATKKLENTNTVFKYINRQYDNHDSNEAIYSKVDEFVKLHSHIFKGKDDKFASQWGAIRGIALATKDDSQIRANILEFISHGTKKESWDNRGRAIRLKEFLEGCDNGNVRKTTINLSSRMAKECRK